MGNGDRHADQSSRRGVRLAIVLAWVGGTKDATGYLLLSHLFTAHMSGNSAALGSRWERHSARALIITDYLIPTQHGGVKITVVNGTQISLVAQDGTIFTFNLATRAFS